MSHTTPHTCFLPILFFLFFGCSYSDPNIIIYPTLSSSDTLEIAMDRGAFIFKELSLSSTQKTEPRLKGKVLNNTGRNWERVEFVVEIYNQKGKRLEGAGYYGRHFVFKNFKVGEIKTIGEGAGHSEGAVIFGFQGKKISKFDIRFGSSEDLESQELSLMVKKDRASSSKSSPIKTKSPRQEHFQRETPPSLWTGNINFFLGKKYLKHEDWKPVDVQNALGIDVDFKSNSWPFSALIGVVQSTGQGKVKEPVSSKVKGKTLEWLAGGRKYFEYGRVQPFISTGLIFVHTEANVKPSRKASAHKGTGLLIESGGLWEFSPSLHAGGSLKYSFAKVKKTANGGGIHAGLFVGWQW